MIAETYIEIALPYIEVNQNFELKYIRDSTQKIAKILTAVLSHQDLLNLVWKIVR